MKAGPNNPVGSAWIDLEILPLHRHRNSEIDRTVVLVIDTDPQQSTAAGGAWWDVAVPEVSARKEVKAARKAYEQARKLQVL